MMEYDEGLVSVVIPAYNRAGMLPTSVASCLEQSYPKVEAIVVDDGSVDDTPAVLARLETKYGKERFRWVRQENGGAPVARNRGMDLARREFLQFLDSDDYLAPVKFEKQVEALRGCDADLAVCDYQCARDFSPASVFQQSRNDGDLHLQVASFGGLGSVFAPLIRRSRMPVELRWNPALRQSDDPDFMFRLFLSVKEWRYTPGFWCTAVHHEEERITEKFRSDGPEYHPLVLSAYEYWAVARHVILPENRWMVPHWVCHFLAGSIRYSRDRRVLRRFARLGLRRPLSGRVAMLCLGMAVKSLVPGFVLDGVACLRGRNGGEE
jgi:glycosyltransferase involved in cell wall biosynthesis